MKKIITYIFLGFFLCFNILFTQSKKEWHSLFASAYFDNMSYDFLGEICDNIGNRMVGTEGNDKVLDMLRKELISLGYEPQTQEFTMPGWFRGDDKIIVQQPFERQLRVAALGYVEKTPAFEAEVVSLSSSDEEYLKEQNIKGKIALFSTPKDSRGVNLELAAKYGAKAALFIGEKLGGLLLTGVANFEGKPTTIPGYSLTYEEGNWLKRLVEKGETVKLYIETNSYCVPELKSYNIHTILPGKVPEKIILGAHIDAWDLGNGGVDNGYGTAIILEVARILKQYTTNNYYTVEFVWFNAEELGLWGSKAFAQSEHSANAVAMFNFDMTGRPTGFNAMGYDAFIPFFEEMVKEFNGFELKQGVVSNPWANSDHFFFMVKGIPSFTLMAHLEKDMYYYYHDFGDTFDKASKTLLSDAAGFISIITYEMANRTDLPYKRLMPDAVREMFQENNLEEQLKRQGWWVFD